MEGHDDEPTRWTSIGWQALLITNRLRCQAQLLNPNEKENEHREGDPKSGDSGEQRRDENRKYVDNRLREIAAWERKFGRK